MGSENINNQIQAALAASAAIDNTPNYTSTSGYYNTLLQSDTDTYNAAGNKYASAANSNSQDPNYLNNVSSALTEYESASKTSNQDNTQEVEAIRAAQAADTALKGSKYSSFLADVQSSKIVGEDGINGLVDSGSGNIYDKNYNLVGSTKVSGNPNTATSEVETGNASNDISLQSDVLTSGPNNLNQNPYSVFNPLTPTANNLNNAQLQTLLLGK